MINKNGKSYVVLEFSDEADAAYFETSFFDRSMSGLLEATAQAKIKDNAFDETTVTNTNTGDVNGTLSQIGVVHGEIAGKRVQ